MPGDGLRSEPRSLAGKPGWQHSGGRQPIVQIGGTQLCEFTVAFDLLDHSAGEIRKTPKGSTELAE